MTTQEDLKLKNIELLEAQKVFNQKQYEFNLLQLQARIDMLKSGTQINPVGM